MDLKLNLKKYANLIIEKGVNIQKDQELLINCPVECAYFTKYLAESAYEKGASFVTVLYNDEELDRINFLNASVEKFKDYPKWKADAKLTHSKKKSAYVCIYAENPDNLKNVDDKKILEFSKSSSQANKESMELSMKNYFPWCVVSLPTKQWAKKVFPNLNEDDAFNKLFEYIFKTTRIDQEDPIKAWETHQENINKRLNFLNNSKFDKLIFKNSLGTDLTIGLSNKHLWCGGGDDTMDNIPFIANIPTEEVYTLPDKNRIDGKVVSSMPLAYNGTVIEDFFIEYKNGKAINFGAKTNEQTLKNILNFDEGTKSLGEVALVPYDSPISNLKTLFFNTLFDENASCHLAIGRGYPACLIGGENMSQEELDKNGLNDSMEHIDFMFGTADLSIIGVKENGEKLEIFKDGNFVI